MPTYKVWTMDSKGTARLVSETNRLRELHSLVAPFREGYVYVLRWIPPKQSHKRHEPKPRPTCKYIWGCFSGIPHTADLRADIRRIITTGG